MFKLKVKAGALQLTLFVIVVIALLLTAFILLVHTHKQFQIQSSFIAETVKQSNNGIRYVLNNSIRLNETKTIDLKDEVYKTLRVHRDFWGVFEKVSSFSQIKNNRFDKVALIGAKQNEGSRTTLYVEDNNKPLVLVGNTRVEGVAYLPKQGVRSGYISGEPYYGSQLIYGETRVSSKFPKLFSEVTNSIFQFAQIYSTLFQDQFLNIQDDGSYSNSFLKPIQIVYSNGDLSLRNIQLTGHILVQSKSKIVVHPSSKLKDVILVAPEIEIQPNTIGNFQAIASEEIIVRNNVKLSYPSALIVNEPQNSTLQNTTNIIEEEHKIIINENAEIKGFVVFLGQDKPNNYKTQILLKENATVYGELYNNQNTELQGIVYGSVFTNNFIANQSGSVYQNHIYNGTISINELPQEYVGLLFNDSKKDIIKWLY